MLSFHYSPLLIWQGLHDDKMLSPLIQPYSIDPARYTFSSSYFGYGTQISDGVLQARGEPQQTLVCPLIIGIGDDEK